MSMTKSYNCGRFRARSLSRIIGLFTISSLVACFLQPALAEADANKRAFKVADSIGMTRLVNFGDYGGPDDKKNFQFSSDGKFFFIVTREGDVESNRNHYELRLFEVSSVQKFVNSNRQRLPDGDVLVRFSTASNLGYSREHAIRSPRWSPDSKTIVFVGDTGDSPGQVYSVDIHTKRQIQLTSHSRNVLFFDFNADMSKLVILSTVPNFSEDRGKTSLVAGTKLAEEVSNLERESGRYFRYQFYSASMGKEESADPIGGIVVGAGITNRRFWVSPDGSKIATVIPYQTGEASKKLGIYEPIRNNSWRNMSLELFDKELMKPNPFYLQFVLIDAKTGHTEIMFDGAPVGEVGGGLEAVWLPGGNSVVVATTYLPKGESNPEEWKRRRQSPAIVDYDVRTKQTTRITDVTVPEGESLAPKLFRDLSIDPDGKLTIRFQDVVNERSLFASYQRRSGRWVSVTPPKQEEQRLSLSIRQDLNSAPEIVATDTKSERARVMTDLNPKFRRLTFGNAKVFDWVDVQGQEWQAGIVFPPDFEADKRYPLVIQTHGFDAQKFLIDGRAEYGGYAAQALANKDMLVLQLPDHFENLARRGGEVNDHRLGIESAIDALHERGLIDRKRVGIQGFSRSGLYVDDMITFSDYDVAAAVMIDASSFNFDYLTMHFGSWAPGMKQVESLLDDAMPWGETRAHWISSVSTFNLDKVKTPLRLARLMDRRNYGSAYWDNYVLMRRLRKPVELLIFPMAHHGSINPATRMDTAQGNVDWFAFWLKGEEDPDPAKAEQYKRWHKFRDEQEKSEIEAIKARQWHKDQEVERERYQQWLKQQGAESVR